MVLERIRMPKLKRNEESVHFTSYVSCGEKNHKFPSIKHTETTFVTNEFRECAAPTVGLPAVGIEALIQVSIYRTFKNVSTAFTSIFLDLRMPCMSASCLPC